MTDKLLIYINSNSIYKCVYDIASSNSESPIIPKETGLIELRTLGKSSQSFSIKEELEILDIINEWQKEHMSLHSSVDSCCVLLSEYFLEHPLSSSTMNSLRSMNNVDILTYSQAGSNYQSLIATKNYHFQMTPNRDSFSSYNLLTIFISLYNEGVRVSLNESHNTSSYTERNLGINKVFNFIHYLLKKKKDYSSIKTYIKSHLSSIIDFIYLFDVNNSCLVGIDEETSLLLLKALNKEIRSQQISVSEIQTLVDNILEADFQLFTKSDFIEEDSLIYCSAKLVTLLFLLESLKINAILVSPEQRIRGYLLCKTLDEYDTEAQYLLIHKYDWKKHAKDVLLSYSACSLSKSLESATLTDIFFEQTKNLLHQWSNREKRLLWLCTLFHSCLSEMGAAEGMSMLKKLINVSYSDCLLIWTIVSITNSDSFAKHSELLNNIYISERQIARHLSGIVRLITSLNASGQSLIHNLTVSHKQGELNTLVLEASSLYNISAEIIQFDMNKQLFETNFDQFIELVQK